MRTQTRLLVFLGLISLGDGLQIQAQPQERPAGTPSAQDAKAPPKLGTIRGRVIATDTGAGLSKTSLMLRSSEPQGRERPLTAKTNAAGEYEFKEVKPGRYYLQANRNGYVNQAYGQKASDLRMSQGTLLVVRAGETLSQVDFKLIRGGIIEGRVVDTDGEPMASVGVMLERFMTQEGKRNLRPMGGGNTDDRGQFRLYGIAPGKYYVSARYRDWQTENEGESTYPPIYFPGTPNAQEAARIEVIAGGQLSGIDIPLSETKAFTVSGKVFRSDGKPAVEAMLSNTRMDDGDDWGGWMGRGGVVDGEGNFKLGGLLPGRYRLAADLFRSDKPQMASLVVEVGNENVRGVVLSLGDGGELSGRLVVEGGNTKLLPPTMRVMLESEGGRMMMSRMQGGEVLEDQTFTLRGVSEGAYRFRIYLPPPNLYLKSARVQGKDALDQPFEIHNGEKLTGAEIVLSADGGEITGVVKQEESEEVARGATIITFSTEASRQIPRSRWTRTTQSDQQGSFRLGAVIPGEYLICAVQNYEFGAESSPEYLRELAKHAKTISVQARSQVNESLVVHPAPEVE